MDWTVDTPALAAPTTVTVAPVARHAPPDVEPVKVSIPVALITATVRLRVPGTVMLIVPTAGIGCVVKSGTPTKNGEAPEIVTYTKNAVPDKIGMTM